MIATLLSWTGLPQWVIELIALGLVAGAIWLWHHETYESGVKAEIARVNAVNAKVTAELTMKAATAEKSHDYELTALRGYRSAHPEQPVSLCLTAPSLQTARTQSVSRSTAPAAAIVQPVPGGSIGVRPAGNPVDIGPLLSAFAASADAVTAQARELQERNQ